MSLDPLLIGKITVAISCIPIITGLYRRKALNQPLFLFLVFKILSLCVNLFEQLIIWISITNYKWIEPYLSYFDIQDTSFIGIFFYILSFIFIGKFYYLLLGKENKGNIILWVSYLLLFCCIVNYLFIEGYKVYGKFNPAVVAIFSFTSAVYYLYHLFRANLALPVRRNPYFWLSLGIILPNVIGIFLFIVGDVVHREDYQLFTTLSSFKNAFLIIGHLLMAIGFYHAPYTRFITLPDEKRV